jgi:hypothetical protein
MLIRYLWLLIIITAPIATVRAQSPLSSTLPLVLINTNGQTIPDEPKIIADLRIVDNGPGKRNLSIDQPTFTSKIGIERRGATSQVFFPKKPYGFELRDTSGLNSVNASILGMPAESDWVLNATYNDKTLIRETLTYDVNRQFSTYYTPRYRYCEVILNGSYEGIYILFEKIKRNKNRVNITSIKKTDITGDALTGGYIFKIDKTDGSPSRSWQSPYTGLVGKPILIQIDRPKPEDLAQEQFEYAKAYVSSFESALNGAQFQDSITGYRKYINDDSFVDYMLLTELCKNVDGYRLSTFFYKDRDSKGLAGKLTIGPIWDYNLAYGNANYCAGNSYQGWAFNFPRTCPNDGFQMPLWWDRLLSDRTFANKVRVKYQTLRQSILKTERIHAYIDSVANVLTESRIRNFQRWPVLGQYVWPNSYVGLTYQDEVSYLKTWIQQRLTWMDTEIQPFGSVVLANEPIDSFELLFSPNPSTGVVTVRYQLTRKTDLRLTIMDSSGQVLQTLALPGQPAGDNQQAIQNLPTTPGVYHVQLTSDHSSVSRKLVRQ